jgi:hypothetical protein
MKFCSLFSGLSYTHFLDTRSLDVIVTVLTVLRIGRGNALLEGDVVEILSC